MKQLSLSRFQLRALPLKRRLVGGLHSFVDQKLSITISQYVRSMKVAMKSKAVGFLISGCHKSNNEMH
uniref:Uncharacterized protein n=1 Tax=Glossina palpalis gambiensis TaxID=67801 RepID=A0A1B0B8S3_9MUSC